MPQRINLASESIGHGFPEVEIDGRGRATMIWPGETEAGSAGTQPCQG